jgi:hypothetical protein
MKKIVTKQSMIEMINSADQVKKMHIVGRALSAIYGYQTQEEKGSDTTIDHNGVGFTGADADWGSRAARFYIRNGWVGQKTVDSWLAPTKGAGGAPKITKYWRQLNVVANIKQDATLRNP